MDSSLLAPSPLLSERSDSPPPGPANAVEVGGAELLRVLLQELLFSLRTPPSHRRFTAVLHGGSSVRL
ncbi:hypothetical protein FQA47_005222 [Oryzias melastigma]|uniref:Uncharacterized protein n=1 Tax=Oryzias melastigma TaxID=30732 RepID=A0A834FBS6_ORYME|nr:hypothetical protein FQA47_005222 [Oryzias melastigma]